MSSIRHTAGSIKNTIRANRMAENAGLRILPGTDPDFPEGVKLPLWDYRTTMLRVYRARKRAMRSPTRRRPQPKPEPWYRRAWKSVKNILPTNARR